MTKNLSGRLAAFARENQIAFRTKCPPFSSIQRQYKLNGKNEIKKACSQLGRRRFVSMQGEFFERSVPPSLSPLLGKGTRLCVNSFHDHFNILLVPFFLCRDFEGPLSCSSAIGQKQRGKAVQYRSLKERGGSSQQ